jgi:hypothetical protein
MYKLKDNYKVNTEIDQLGNNPIAVFAHDAGAAMYIAKLLKMSCTTAIIDIYVSGPAKNIFQKELKSYKGNNLTFKELVKSDFTSYAYILTGSGWSSDFELEGLKLAKEFGVSSITLLDHWTNFRRRLTRGDELFLPDTIWVLDDHAIDLAKDEFRDLKVTITKIGDPIKFEISELVGKVNEEKSILYVTEPIGNIGKMNQVKGERIFSEKDFFLKFTNIIKGLDLNLKIYIRVHPSESREFYNELIMQSGLNASISKIDDPLVEILKSRYVVGMESIMLAWAINAGKSVYTMLPKGKHRKKIPYKAIGKFEDVTTLS